MFSKRERKRNGNPVLGPLFAPKWKEQKKKVALRRARVRERNARSNGQHSREEVLSERRERYASRVYFPIRTPSSARDARAPGSSKNPRAKRERGKMRRAPRNATARASSRTIKAVRNYRTFSRPSTFVFKTRKMCWKSSPTIKAMFGFVLRVFEWRKRGGVKRSQNQTGDKNC